MSSKTSRNSALKGRKENGYGMDLTGCPTTLNLHYLMIFMFVAPALLRLTDTTIDEHINGNPGCKNSQQHKLFDCILFIPGAGHIELNLLRAIFSFTRHIFMEKIADLLEFSSKAAKDFIINCGNHHISWKVMQIVISAFGAELFRVYIIECRKTSTEPQTLQNGKKM